MNLLNNGKKHFYLTDGGLETTLIFHNGINLNHFAAFELLNEEDGRLILVDYYRHYLELALRFNTGFILETPTWRANSDWAYKLGYSAGEINAINTQSILFLRRILQNPAYAKLPVLVSGTIGPRGDGYKPDTAMQPGEAATYHAEQVHAFKLAGADFVTAYTINYVNEAVGIVLSAKAAGIPVVMSFTVETDGRLPNGESLQSAIEQTDAQTAAYVSYYMINCAHPEHFKDVLNVNEKWKERIVGIRANASAKSHKDLDESLTLDEGDKCGLANGYHELLQLLPGLRVIGGCCGTDHTHLEEIGKVLFENGQRVTF